MDTEQCTVLMRLSCAKIVNSRHRRGGVNLHKNLLILHVIKRVQDTKSKLAIQPVIETVFVSEEDCEEEEDDNTSPPLEFTVTDSDDACADDATHEPLAFASEATEDSLLAVAAPQPLSPAIDDALSRLGERKRKSDIRPAPRQKTLRVVPADGLVPVLRTLHCK